MSSPAPSLWQTIAGDVRAELARQRRTGLELAQVLHLSRNSVYRRLNAEVPFDLAELEAIGEWLNVDLNSWISDDAAIGVTA